ncbi:hypothetical protein SO802_020594 [Lithocarpus litseifolius]|uniref:RNase H type-1 domain-containing protein n=1 Tax=Lithocarpus litseifolius TaxID=425828 RepID=A0AAW2CE22_9ROSI
MEGAVRSIAFQRRNCNGKGTSAVVSAPGPLFHGKVKKLNESMFVLMDRMMLISGRSHRMGITLFVVLIECWLWTNSVVNQLPQIWIPRIRSVKENLKKRQIQVDVTCSLCDDFEEDTMHALWLCDQAQSMWKSEASFVYLYQRKFRTFMDLFEAVIDRGSVFKVVFEGDSLRIVQAVNSQEACLTLCGHVIGEIKSLRRSLRFSCFQHVKRDGNKLAHSFARRAVSSADTDVWVEELPSYLEDVFQFDFDHQ